MNTVDLVDVRLDTPETAGSRAVGSLRRSRSGSRIAISFAYERTWLDWRVTFALDPSLQPYDGDQYQPHGGLPGIFADAAPDRWGRTLLERREALLARREGRSVRRLDEWDFLLGVSDVTRMGALRLAEPDGDRLLDDSTLSVPPMARLRELQHWARKVESGAIRTEHEEDAWLALLVAPGSSLGGARPKATFAAEDGTLWLAKFPSSSDDHDVGAWEFVVTELARGAGIEVPEPRLLSLGGQHRTFAARRFDRSGSARHHYASAMTMTGKRDGDDASYLDLLRAIEDHGAVRSLEADLHQLFRRGVFNVLASNRDDHLRNHGFLRSKEGWRLAPAFDLNPAPDKPEHGLSLDGTLRIPEISLIEESAAFYRLTASQARLIVDEVRTAIGKWRLIAAAAGLPRDEIDLFAPSFVVQ